MTDWLVFNWYLVYPCLLLLCDSNSVFVSTGGNGYINDYPMGRFLRDAKLYEIGAGTSEVRRMVIGRAFNAMFK